MSNVDSLVQRMSGSTSVAVLINRMTMQIADLLDAECCTVFLHEPLTDQLFSFDAAGDGRQPIRFASDRGIAGNVFRSGHSTRVPDAVADPRFDAAIDECAGQRSRHLIAVPVIHKMDEHTDRMGVVLAMNRHCGEFTAADVARLEDFVAHAAPLLANALLHEELAQSRIDEAKLLQVTTEISTELQLQELLVKIMLTVRDLLDSDKATLFIYDRKSHELWIGASLDASVKSVRFPADRGIAGSVFTTGVSINIPDAYADPRFNQEVDRRTGYRTRSILCMPVANRKGERIAVIQALNKSGGVFSTVDEKRLAAFSAQAAISIENAQLFDEVLRIKNYNESILRSMSSGVITVDNAGHIETLNAAALRVLRLDERADPTPLAGTPIQSLFAGANAWVAESIESVEKTGKTDLAVDVELELPWIAEGSEAPVLSIDLAVVPLRDEKELPMGALVMLEDLTREKRLKSTMSRYMNKELADRLLAEGDQALGGKLQVATAMFTDLRNFTTISEQIGPQETVRLLNDYFTIMVDIVLTRGGMLDKYIGDAIMAVFGVPFAGPDDADRAVLTALDMLQALCLFNTERVSAGLDPIGMGIGINTGDMVMGNVGSPKRMDYTVIGDGVNLASRLEGANKHYGTQLLVSEFTVAALKLPYKLREVDRIRVKGKNHPVGIFEVIAALDPAHAWSADPVLERYAAGIAAYRNRDWSGASASFAAVLAAWPEDGVAKRYLERCSQFEARPPGPTWDGSWTMREK